MFGLMVSIRSWARLPRIAGYLIAAGIAEQLILGGIGGGVRGDQSQPGAAVRAIPGLAGAAEPFEDVRQELSGKS
jgi:hypothetical protein